jgi:hypothetical protein
MKHAITVAVALSGLTGLAQAADLPCGPAEKGTITLDGLTDDWNEVAGLDGGGRDGNASFTVKCNVEDNRTLVLLFDVRDNYMVRTRQQHPGEDHLTLTLAGRPLSIFPGDARSIPTVVRWGTKAAQGVKAVSALQTHGYSVELALPLGSLPGYKQGMPIPYRAELADSDSKADLKTERTVDLAGSIVFAEGDSALDGFLADRKLRKSDIWFDKGARLGGKAGARVVLAGRYMAAITDGYVYIELPVQARSDVKDARLVDLAGDGREALASPPRAAPDRARSWPSTASPATPRSVASSPPRWPRPRPRAASRTRWPSCAAAAPPTSSSTPGTPTASPPPPSARHPPPTSSPSCCPGPTTATLATSSPATTTSALSNPLPSATAVSRLRPPARPNLA